MSDFVAKKTTIVDGEIRVSVPELVEILVAAKGGELFNSVPEGANVSVSHTDFASTPSVIGLNKTVVIKLLDEDVEVVPAPEVPSANTV